MDTTLRRLIDSYREDNTGDSRSKWIALAREFFDSKDRPPVLSGLGDDLSVVLHGSTTRNVDDPSSDLDFYLLLDEEDATRFDTLSESRFIDVIINGKPGHLNLTLYSDIESAFAIPSFETIYELQHAVAVLDPKDRFEALSSRARLPMEEALRRASLLFNYVEMRSFHRSADNPMDRNDRLAAALTPTGRLVLEHVDRILDLIQTDATSLNGPEAENAISSELRHVRSIIVDCAKKSRIDEPWLDKWWHFFDAQRAAFDGIEWSA